MRQKIVYWVFGSVLTITASASFAQPPADTAESVDFVHSPVETTGIIEYATPPELLADAVVVYTPMTDMALDKMRPFERVITGRIDRQEMGQAAPGLIVHKADTIIMPLQAGKPVRLYLKRFPDRDAYYPIAIFPVANQGAKQ